MYDLLTFRDVVGLGLQLVVKQIQNKSKVVELGP